MDEPDSEALRETFFEVVDNQIRGGEPPETKQTYDRLIAKGFSAFETKQMIASAIVVEMYDIMKHGREFDENRYVCHLLALPTPPFEEDDEE